MKSPQTSTNELLAVPRENYFQWMMDNIDEAFVLLDKDFRIVESNRAAREGLWGKAGFVLYPGFSVLDAVEEDRVPLLRHLFAEVLTGCRRKTEYALTQPDGVTLHIENNLLPARNGQNEIVGIIVHSKNITEEKNSQRNVQQAEERWQFAFEASNQAAWDWNMETNEVIYSSSYKKMYGFVDDDLKNDVSEWLRRIHPDDRKKMENHLEKHLESKDPLYETTYRIQLKNGEYKWILARGKIIQKDDNGKPLRMIGTHTDLTEKMNAEEQLRTMHDRFVFASKASSQALWEWDAVSGQAYVSPSFTEIFGWEADSNNYFEQWHQYVHPDDRKAIIGDYYHTLEHTTSEIWKSEYRFLKADGSYAIVSDTAYILRNEKHEAVKVIGATQDITAQKRIEEELRESNERYHFVMKATNELLWEWDFNAMKIYRSNEGLKRVYGMNDDSLVKTPEEWLQRIHPDDYPYVKSVFEKIFAGSNLEQFEIEYRFLNGDGGYNHVYGRGILLTDENGKPVRMIGTEQNISERKRLEQELLQRELAYKKLINQATVDSQEQERSEIGRELHDNINQVLTTTKLYLELALSSQEMMPELVKKSSKSISTVINEIRQLSRSLMDPTLGDLGIVDSIKDLIENINMTRKLTVNLEIDEAIENLLNRNQKLTIFRIVQESLNNVIRHAKAQTACISIQLAGEDVQLSIDDDGIGFIQESVKKGAGLKNITNRVYLINGQLTIHSQPGIGCRIHIQFPVNNAN